MSTPYWTATIASVGEDSQEMIDAGVLILFGEPCPPALADVSLVHQDAAAPARDVQSGDTLDVGDQSWSIDRVGEKASANLRDLGHIVIYIDPGEDSLLPGAVHVRGSVPNPSIGDVVSLRGD